MAEFTTYTIWKADNRYVMVIKSIVIEFVQARQVGLVPGEVNVILGDVMGSTEQ